MKYILQFIIILNLVIFSVPAGHAEDVWQMAESPQYGRKAVGMLGRGLINAASCFVDFFVHTVRETQEGPPLVGTLTGMGSGAACTVLRAGSGVLDVASFWVPGFNGLPVSRSYENCMIEDSYGTPNYSPPSSASRPIGSTSSASMPRSTAKAPSAPAPSSTSHNPTEYVKK